MRRSVLFIILIFAAILNSNLAKGQCSNPPDVGSPTATSITTTTATLGGTLVANGGGGGCNANYGIRYSTSTPVALTNQTSIGTSSSDGVVFSTPVAGLTAGTKYYYTAYAINSNSPGRDSTLDNGTVFFYTPQTNPGGYPASFAFNAAVNGNNIDLTFTKASRTPQNAHGYVVLRRAGSDPDLTGISDGAAQSSPYFLTTITDSTDVDFTDNTALGGVAYRYALVPFRVVSDPGPIATTYNYGTLSSIATATVPLVTTIDEITGGIAPSPLGSSATTQAILGFSISSNGAPNFTAINIQVTSSAVNKIAVAYLYQSANNSFGGDSPVGSVADNLTGTQIQLSGFSVGLTSTPKYFFIVVDVMDTVSASSPTLTPSFTNANISISGGGTVTVNSSPITGLTYSFVDNSPPTISSRVPTNGATDLSVLLDQFTITFNEPVAYIGDNSDNNNRIRLWNDNADVFVDTIEIANVSVVGNVVTFTTDESLSADVDYDIIIGNSVFEDIPGNDFPGITEDNWEFETEQGPNISGLSNSGIRCIGDQLVISGSRFNGTGGSGTAKPFVFINGVQVPDANVTLYSSNSITLTVPASATDGNVIVENRDNFLTSNGSALDVHPQINTGLTVTPATFSPAQNQSVVITIGGTQSSSYQYSLIANSVPAGYTAITQNANGSNGNLNLTTTPILDEIGDYTYRIEVSRSGCTTRTLTNTPFTLTVASLTATVNATDVTVCVGSSSILIGSTSGGTGFYQFSWTGPNGFSSTSSSPTITPAHPAGTGWYILTLSDNSDNEAKDSVYINTYPVPVAAIIPNPADPPEPAQTAVRTNYVVEDRDYLVSGSPAGGVFTGQGIVLKNDGRYYFNPLNAGLGNWPITYSYSDVNGCSDSDTRNFLVQSLTVNGAEQLYCKNRTSDTGLSVNIANAIRPGYQFTRIRFYGYYNGNVYYDNYQIPAVLGVPGNNGLMPPGATYPLSVTSLTTVDDASTIAVGDNITVPNTYTLDLDAVRNGWGYGYYYLDIFAKDQFGNEALQSWAFFQVVDNGPLPSIVGINHAENICEDAAIITLSASEPGYSVTNFTIAPAPPTVGNFSTSLSGTNNEDFDPSDNSFDGANERPLIISMAYEDYNNCPNTVTRNFNWVKKPSAPTAADVSYCRITTGVPGTFTIDGSSNGPADKLYWYELNPVVNPGTPILDSLSFSGFVAPGITGLIALSKDFYVTQSYKGCEGAVEPVNLEIREAPDASITYDPPCEDRSFNVYGPQQSPGVAYDTYEWYFGDGSPNVVVNNDSVATHNYGPGSGATPHTIVLTVTNTSGCTNTDAIGIVVGLNPNPNFNFSFVCEDDRTEFYDNTDPSIPVLQFAWDFGDGATIPVDTAFDGPDPVPAPLPETGTMKDPIHGFLNGNGDYTVTMTAYTAAGCFNSIGKTVTILDTLIRSTTNRYDITDVIPGSNSNWTLQDVAGNSTWEYAVPTSPIMNSFTTDAWVTNASGAHSPNEESYLNSPCLNIASIERPVLSMDFIMNTDQGRDGLVVQYTVDGGVTWLPLGNINSGFNWFNTAGFFTGTIGGSSFGWSGNSWELPDNTAGDTLVQARRALDNLSITPAQMQRIRFRIAFKSDASVELAGFAFNNLTIETRNRIILVENFTNEADDTYTTNNTQFVSIPTDEAVKLQYHLGYPEEDPNYLMNMADPSARGAYYGIPLNNQYIPRGYIDGFSSGNFNGTVWVTNKRNERALKVAPYKLTVSTLHSSNNDHLTVIATALTLDSIPEDWTPILHLAVVQKTEGINQFVLRKMIPSAAGTRLPSDLPKDDTQIIIDSVRFDNPNIDFNDLAIVAFIQDEVTKEVYQAAIDLTPDNPPTGIVTGIEDPSYAEKISLFPNPASHEVNIELPTSVTRATPVKMVDTHGRTVYESAFAPGEQVKTVNTSELSGGVYIFQIRTPEGNVARRKIMVIHR